MGDIIARSSFIGVGLWCLQTVSTSFIGNTLGDPSIFDISLVKVAGLGAARVTRLNGDI